MSSLYEIGNFAVCKVFDENLSSVGHLEVVNLKGLELIEGVTATRCFSPLLGKIE